MSGDNLAENLAELRGAWHRLSGEVAAKRKRPSGLTVAPSPPPQPDWTSAAKARATSDKGRKSLPLYLRFGEPPRGGRSACLFRAPALEAGVSVFRARRVECGYEVLAPGLVSPVFWWASSQGRAAYLLEGDELLEVRCEVGQPLLGNVTRAERVPDGVNVKRAGYSDARPNREERSA